jgi:hypothetical protein
LFHGTNFDLGSFLAANMALTTSIPLGTKKQGLFLHLWHTQNQKGKKIKNPMAKHCNFLQDYTIRPIKGVG